MKYLKLFENIKSFYKEISEDDYNYDIMGYEGDPDYKYINNNWIEFNKKEIDIIESFFDNYRFRTYTDNGRVYKYYISIFINTYNYDGVGSTTIPLGRLDIKSHLCFKDKGEFDKIKIIIIKLKDEWYYAYNLRRKQFYKCDQFEGLLKCLKDTV